MLAPLELLKDNPARYVRRSVPNNRTDIGKDHRGLPVETCRRWSRHPTPQRARLIRHALRSVRIAPSPVAIGDIVTVAIEKRISLEQRTTRTHRPGWHAVDAPVDGRAIAVGGFEVVPRR
jgi:3-methyladenine DNA glycosylase AlkC